MNRDDVFAKTNGRCAYCGIDLSSIGSWHVEHMVPRSRGGNSDIDNLVASCPACNVKKGRRTVLEFEEYLLNNCLKHIDANLNKAMSALDDFKKFQSEETRILIDSIIGTILDVPVVTDLSGWPTFYHDGFDDEQV